MPRRQSDEKLKEMSCVDGISKAEMNGGWFTPQKRAIRDTDDNHEMEAGDIPFPTSLERDVSIPGAIRVESSGIVTPLSSAAPNREQFEFSSTYLDTENSLSHHRKQNSQDSSVPSFMETSHDGTDSLFMVDEAVLAPPQPQAEPQGSESEHNRFAMTPPVKAEPLSQFVEDRKSCQFRTLLLLLFLTAVMAGGLAFGLTRESQITLVQRAPDVPCPNDSFRIPGLRNCVKEGERRRVRTTHFATWGSLLTKNDGLCVSEFPSISIACAHGMPKVERLENSVCNPLPRNETRLHCQKASVAIPDGDMIENPLVFFSCSAPQVEAAMLTANVKVSASTVLVNDTTCQSSTKDLSFVSAGLLCRSETTPNRSATPVTGSPCVTGNPVYAEIDSTSGPFQFCVDHHHEERVRLEVNSDGNGPRSRDILRQCVDDQKLTPKPALRHIRKSEGVLGLIGG